MMDKRVLIPVFAPVLLLFLLTSCATPPELRNPAYLSDTSLVDGNPCAAPCFRGITPGETDWQDALTILEDDASLADVESEVVEGGVVARWRDADGIPCCLMLTFEGDRVDQMLLQFAPGMTAGDLFEAHGEPSYITGVDVSPEQASLALYFPDKGMVVYAFVAGTAEGELSESSEIFAALYVRPQDMQDVLTYSDLYAFEGFGSYQELVVGEFDKTAAPTLEPTQAAEATQRAREAADGAATPEVTPEATES